MKKELHEIESRLFKLQKRKSNIAIDEIHRIGLAVPIVRKELKMEYSFSQSSQKEILKVWDYIWRESKHFETMSLSLYFYQWKTLSKTEVNTIKKWVDRCTCWEHSDDLSKIYAQVLEENPEWMLPTLNKWNKSKCLWKRRQSVVSLLEYASKRKKALPFDELISFITPLLDDEEYYVQKGIGWTLREIYNVYPAKTLAFFKKNLATISPIAYSAATEKIDKKTKSQLNLKRKELRKTL